jgi:hypothetical protein
MYKGGTKGCPTGKLRHRTEGQAVHVARGPGPMRNRVAVYCTLCDGWHLEPAPASKPTKADITRFSRLPNTSAFGSIHR